MRLVRLPVLLAAAALLLGACSGAGATPVPTAAPTAAASSGSGGATGVAIRDFAFAPEDASTSADGTVTWTNEDSAPHTVTFDDSSVSSSGNLSKGQTFSVTFATAGTFTYKCAIHPSMTGTVSVM